MIQRQRRAPSLCESPGPAGTLLLLPISHLNVDTKRTSVVSTLSIISVASTETKLDLDEDSQ